MTKYDLQIQTEKEEDEIILKIFEAIHALLVKEGVDAKLAGIKDDKYPLTTEEKVAKSA